MLFSATADVVAVSDCPLEKENYEGQRISPAILAKVAPFMAVQVKSRNDYALHLIVPLWFAELGPFLVAITKADTEIYGNGN